VTGFNGYMKRYQFQTAMRKWETGILAAEIEFVKLQDQAEYSKRVEPFNYYGKLMQGVLCIAFSANWFFLLMFKALEEFNGKDYSEFEYIEHVS